MGLMADFKSLKDVPGEKVFVFCNGSRAQNIYQLADTIEHTNDGVFTFHANEDHNDFAAWVQDALEDASLARLLRHETDRYWFIQKVRGHIKFLENMG